MTPPSDLSHLGHRASAEAFELRAEESLKAAAMVPMGDPEGPELLADAQAAATLALSHRTAQQTELWGALVGRSEGNRYNDFKGTLFLNVRRP